MNFRYRLMQFMSRRCGPDEIFITVFSVSVALSLINVFVRSLILQLVVYALIVYCVFRLFSRNTERRRRENSWFKDKIHFIKRRKEFIRQRRADKCHVYKK